jgi:hypothetical protein
MNTASSVTTQHNTTQHNTTLFFAPSDSYFGCVFFLRNVLVTGRGGGERERER